MDISAISSSLLQTSPINAAGIRSVTFLLDTSAITSANSVEIVDISGLGQLLSASSIFETVLLKAAETNQASLSNIVAATQFFVDAFNTFLQSGSLQSSTGGSLGNLFIRLLNSQATASSDDGSSILDRLSRVGINVQPPTTQNTVGEVTIDFETLQAALNIDLPGTVSLLAQTTREIGQLATEFTNLFVQVNDLGQTSQGLSDIATLNGLLAATATTEGAAVAGTIAATGTAAAAEAALVTGTAATTGAIAAAGTTAATEAAALAETEVARVTVAALVTGTAAATAALATTGTTAAVEAAALTEAEAARVTAAATEAALVTGTAASTGATAATVTTAAAEAAALTETEAARVTVAATGAALVTGTAAATGAAAATGTTAAAETTASARTTTPTGTTAATAPLSAAEPEAVVERIAAPIAAGSPTALPAAPAVAAAPAAFAPAAVPLNPVNPIIDASNPAVAAAIAAYHVVDGIFDSSKPRVEEDTSVLPGQSVIEPVTRTHPTRLDLFV